MVRLMIGLWVLASSILSFPLLGATPQTFRISAVPDETPSELTRKFQPLAAYLTEETGLSVEFTLLTSYEAAVEALSTKKVEMVWYGGLTYVQARVKTKNNVIPLVMRKRDLKFRSHFIAPVDSGITSLKDLKDKDFVFGSKSSNSGHLMPRFYLKEAGISPERDFKKFSFSGAHDATARWVSEGKAQVGALNEAVWEKLVKSKEIDTKKVKVFYTTPSYVNYSWTVRGDIDRLLLTKIASAFLRLDPNKKEHRKILALQRANQYVLALASDFDGIHSAAKEAGLLK